MTSSSIPQKKTIDEKVKNKMMNDILKDNPKLSFDPLVKHRLEDIVEAYLLDPDGFNKRTTAIQKKDK